MFQPLDAHNRNQFSKFQGIVNQQVEAQTTHLTAEIE